MSTVPKFEFMPDLIDLPAGFERFSFVYFHGAAEDYVRSHLYCTTRPDERPAPDLVTIKGRPDPWYEGPVEGELILGFEHVPIKGWIWIEWWVDEVTKFRSEPPPAEGWLVSVRDFGKRVTYGIKKPRHHRGLLCLPEDEKSLAYAEGRFYERAVCL